MSPTFNLWTGELSIERRCPRCSRLHFGRERLCGPCACDRAEAERDRKRDEKAR